MNPSHRSIVGMNDPASLLGEFSEIGELRKGAPKAQGLEELDHFRFTSKYPEIVQYFNQVFGARPNNIPVYLPYNGDPATGMTATVRNFESYYAEFTKSGLQRRCNGQTMYKERFGKVLLDVEKSCLRFNSPTGICPACGDKPRGVLYVIIPELLPGVDKPDFLKFGVVRVLTSSKFDNINLPKRIAAIAGSDQKVTGVPCILSRVLGDVPTPGYGRQKKWLIDLTIASTYAAALIESGQSKAFAMLESDVYEAPLGGDDEPISLSELSAVNGRYFPFSNACGQNGQSYQEEDLAISDGKSG